MSGEETQGKRWTQQSRTNEADESNVPSSIAQLKVHRHVVDMLGFLDVVAEIVDKGRESFVDPVNLIDFHAAKSLLIDLNSAADAIALADPTFQAGHPEVPWSDLHQTRSKLSHHYEGIYRARLWGTLTVDLAAIRPILEELAGDEGRTAE